MADLEAQAPKVVYPTEYVDITAEKDDPEVLAVMAEWAKDPDSEKEVIDYELINTFYSRPEKVEYAHEEGELAPDWFFHILLTREQYEKRVADRKHVVDFMAAPQAHKKLRKGSTTIYRPIHTFGMSGQAQVPREKQQAYEDTQIVATLDEEKS